MEFNLSFLIETIAKISFIAILALYIIFAFVVVNQTRVMNKTAHLSYSSILLSLSLFHLFLAISLFIFALVIL